MITYQPYTYLVGWSAINKWYYGVRFAKNCQPADLWTTYFTSSKYVALLRETHGEPDIIQIRKTFTDAKSACLWEDKVLRRCNVTQNTAWVNRSVAGHWDATLSFPNQLKGKTYTEVYGAEKAAEWLANSLASRNKWWASDAGKVRKDALVLQNNKNPSFTTVGREPHNKVKATFEFTCEFCNQTQTRRDLVTQRRKKTCGSKSCAARWTHKYR